MALGAGEGPVLLGSLAEPSEPPPPPWCGEEVANEYNQYNPDEFTDEEGGVELQARLGSLCCCPVARSAHPANFF